MWSVGLARSAMSKSGPTTTSNSSWPAGVWRVPTICVEQVPTSLHVPFSEKLQATPPAEPGVHALGSSTLWPHDAQASA